MTKKETYHVSNTDIKEGRLMGVLCYIIAVIPYLIEKDNKFVKFHAREGMKLLLVTVIYYIIDSYLKTFIKIKTCSNSICIYSTPIIYDYIVGLIKIIFLAYSLYGIINVILGKCNKLPLIGKIKLFKTEK